MLLGCLCFLFWHQRLKVREAAGVFFVVVGNGKNGLIKLIVAKLLESHRGCDRRKDRDVEFDRKARRELHLNKLPEFIKVLEGSNDFKNIQQRFNAQREVLTHGYRGFEVFLALFADQLSPQMRCFSIFSCDVFLPGYSVR